MGKLACSDAPEVEAVIDEICRKAREAGVMIGTAVGSDPATVEKWRKRGAAWLAVISDCGCLTKVSGDILDRPRES